MESLYLIEKSAEQVINEVINKIQYDLIMIQMQGGDYDIKQAKTNLLLDMLGYVKNNLHY